MKKLKIVLNFRLELDSTLWVASMKLLNRMMGDLVIQNVHYLTICLITLCIKFAICNETKDVMKNLFS